jgi:hypothetical protein
MGEQVGSAVAGSAAQAAIGGMASGVKAGGQIAGGAAARRAGEAKQKASEFTAQQLEQNAGQQQAASQRAAQEELRKSMLLQSRAIAVAAASGGGALDPTVVRLVGSLSKEGQLAFDTAIYGGEERARGMVNQAKATRYEGAQQALAGREAEKAARIGAGSTILSGAMKDWGSGGFNFGGAPADDSEVVVKAPIYERSFYD